MVMAPITVRVQEHVLRVRLHRQSKEGQSGHEQETPEELHPLVMVDAWMWHRASQEFADIGVGGPAKDLVLVKSYHSPTNPAPCPWQPAVRPSREKEDPWPVPSMHRRAL